jgi:hypothetical protein
VLGFGGLLGLGSDHYPLPWQSLKYDTRVGAYRTGVTQDQLRARRNFATKACNWGDPARNRALDEYCDVSGMPLA